MKKTGSARVPKVFKTKDGFTLGRWVSTQRITKDSLSVERRSLLESCKGWTWDLLTDQWNEAFEHLHEYVNKNRSARMTQDFTTKNGFTLGTWVSTQRTTKDSLSVERRSLLESLKGWSWNLFADKWNDGFEQLKHYVKTTGSASGSTSFKTNEGLGLGNWVSRQRKYKNSLSTERRKLLESCKGWSWDPLTDQWNEGFEQLKQYVKTTGSVRVPATFKTNDGFALGCWVSNQRAKKDSLSAECRKLLETSCKDWSWDVLTEQWNEAFEHLQEYVNNNGSARVPTTFTTKDGFNLGQWVSTQRITKDSLSVERRSLLESCKGWTWDLLTDQWNEAFEHLQEYVNNNGSARVSRDAKIQNGFNLGTWIGRQRNTKDSLSVERRSLLESCKGWTWDPLTDQWNEAFEHLQEYVNNNGSARVPKVFKTKDGFALGNWVGRQRDTKDSLSVERRSLLESCKGWSWDSLTDQWNAGFVSLQEFVRKTGSARVPQRFKTQDGFGIGQWVATQRKTKDSLSAQRRSLLESCKGWTWDASNKPTK